MRIAVIGAGLAGVTTAYELARDGHEVVVFERRGGLAAEGSFASACLSAPGDWLAAMAAGHRGGLDLPVAASPIAWALYWRAWYQARQPAHATRLSLMTTLTQLSAELRQTIVNRHALNFDRHRGVTALLRSPGHARRAQALLAQHADLGLPVRWLNAGETREAEPGLSPALSLEGALYWATGEVANGRQYAHALKAEAQQLGVRFAFQQDVTSLANGSGDPAGVELSIERTKEQGDAPLAAGMTGATTLSEETSPVFDSAVLCTCTGAQRLLGRSALGSRVRAAHVHSITAPLREPADAHDAVGPRGGVMDATSGATIMHLGDRVRVASRPALGEAPSQPSESVLAQLYRLLEDEFPGATRTARAHPWVGRQNIVADGLPVVGTSQRSGVWLHFGLGNRAWAWANATARQLADQLAGKPAPLAAHALSPSRLR